MTKKWIKINDLPSGQYYLNKKIKFKNSLSRSNLCDYSNAYIFVKKNKISATGINDANRKNKILVFKKNFSFRSCITKLDNMFVDNVDDLDILITLCQCKIC